MVGVARERRRAAAAGLIRDPRPAASQCSLLRPPSPSNPSDSKSPSASDQQENLSAAPGPGSLAHTCKFAPFLIHRGAIPRGDMFRGEVADAPAVCVGCVLE